MMLRSRFKIFFVILCTVLMITVSGQVRANPPGCAPEYSDIMRNAAAAEVAEGAAYGKEIIEQPSSAKALSCFDQSMAASAKAGAIFSDKDFTASLPAWGGVISIGLGGSLGGPFGNGTTRSLADQLTNVIDPVLSNLLGNFGASLSAIFGSLLSSAYSAIVGPLLSLPILGSYLSGILGLNMNCDYMQQLWGGTIIGQGINPDVGYAAQRDILNAAVGWGTSAMTQLTANSGVLGQALTDLNNLSTSGFYPFRPTIPVISPTASVSAVIANF